MYRKMSRPEPIPGADRLAALFVPNASSLENPSEADVSTLALAVADAIVDGNVGLVNAIRDRLRMSQALWDTANSYNDAKQSPWLGILRIVEFAAGRLMPVEKLGITPNSYRHRFLAAVLLRPGASNEDIGHLIEKDHDRPVDETETSRAGRYLRGQGLVIRRQFGRVNSWTLTPNGEDVLTQLPALDPPIAVESMARNAAVEVWTSAVRETPAPKWAANMVGTIDTSTAYEVIHYLRSTDQDPPSRWACQGAFNTTLLLIDAPHLLIAANPAAPGLAIGPYDVLLKELDGLISDDRPPDALTETAAALTERWAALNYPTLLRERESMKQSANTLRYTKIPVNLWIDHVHRSGGMFDERFTTFIASVMNTSVGQVEALHELSKDDEKIRQAYENLETSDTGRLLVDAFVVSWLLRGRLHTEVARLQGRQIVQHPRRDAIQPTVTSALPYKVTDVTRYLAGMALNLAMREGDLDSRIRSWAGFVKAVREAIVNDAIDVLPAGGREEAVLVAIAAARKIGVLTDVEEAIERATLGRAEGGPNAASVVALAQWSETQMSGTDGPIGIRLEDWRPTPGQGKAFLGELITGPGGLIRPMWPVSSSSPIASVGL